MPFLFFIFLFVIMDEAEGTLDTSSLDTNEPGTDRYLLATSFSALSKTASTQSVSWRKEY